MGSQAPVGSGLGLAQAEQGSVPAGSDLDLADSGLVPVLDLA